MGLSKATLRREKNEHTLTGDEEVDELLFEIAFEFMAFSRRNDLELKVFHMNVMVFAYDYPNLNASETIFIFRN